MITRRRKRNCTETMLDPTGLIHYFLLRVSTTSSSPLVTFFSEARARVQLFDNKRMCSSPFFTFLDTCEGTIKEAS